MSYDQNTTLVFGYKYTFQAPTEYADLDKRVFVGTFIDEDHGSYFDEDDNKYRYFDRLIINVDGKEMSLPGYFKGQRIFD